MKHLIHNKNHFNLIFKKVILLSILFLSLNIIPSMSKASDDTSLYWAAGILAVTAILLSSSDDSSVYYVTANKLNIRNLPDVSGDVVGTLKKGDKVTIYEENYDWVRISNESEKKWVYKKYLSKEQPSEFTKKTYDDNYEISNALKSSDNFAKYKSSMIKATKKLVENNICTLEDLKYIGGWVKSTLNYKNEPIYFIYCGGLTSNHSMHLTSNDRIYLNVLTGEMFR